MASRQCQEFSGGDHQKDIRQYTAGPLLYCNNLVSHRDERLTYRITLSRHASNVSVETNRSKPLKDSPHSSYCLQSVPLKDDTNSRENGTRIVHDADGLKKESAVAALLYVVSSSKAQQGKAFIFMNINFSRHLNGTTVPYRWHP